MALDPRIVQGNLPDLSDFTDEPNMLVQSLTFTASRTKNAYKGANRCTQGIEYTDPIGTFAFEAFVSERAGLCDTHPGTAVAELANFEAARFGFDPADGIMVYEDPSSTCTLDAPETVKFNVVHYPFVTA